jgi:hypothetical protein
MSVTASFGDSTSGAWVKPPNCRAMRCSERRRLNSVSKMLIARIHSRRSALPARLTENANDRAQSHRCQAGIMLAQDDEGSVGGSTQQSARRAE